MNLCNYNYNIMSLNLFGISTTTFKYEFLPELGIKTITISSSKFLVVPYLRFYKSKLEKEFKNQWDFTKNTYHLFAFEKIMEIKFAEVKS
jgi:hypothetical protein